MPAPFKQINREQFAALLDKFDFQRRINAVHMHHTWRPDHSNYDPTNGHRTIVGMFLSHTQKNGWQDIAQHITIAPDGSIWLGRNWNAPPASAAGHNGSAQIGPFMFETIGNFDTGHDALQGEQLRTVIEVIARVQKRFNLPPETLRFHNSMSTKTCPGTGVSYDGIVSMVRAFDFAPPAAASRSAHAAPFPADATDTAQIVEESIRSLGDTPRYADPPDAEPDHEHDDDLPIAAVGIKGRGEADVLTPEVLTQLRPHLVNLNQGKFSDEGNWKTEPGDVDAIFDQHLPDALAQATAKGQPLRIVFYAHGGLVKESLGLLVAHKHLQFWKSNGIYPINFVWETGLFETLGQLLRRSKDGTRNIFSDAISDPIIETTARALQGASIWGGMKLSAERSVAAKDSPHGEGGARYVAQKLKEFCDRHSDAKIELHAAGHSAGSIFHSHFLSTAHELGAPSFASLHLLAPAVRVDVFKRLALGMIGPGKGIDRATIYTMTRDYERADNCANVYRKSLLYLVHFSLEPEQKAAILGLEQSLRADPDLVQAFGLGAARGAPGEVVFSVTPLRTGLSASASTTHGGFDDDAPTMGSVARRILGKQDADVIVEYQTGRGARGADSWADQVDWPYPELAAAANTPAPAVTTAAAPQPAPPQQPTVTTSAATGGRRLALCIGIDDYPSAPLSGCIADSQEWARTFDRLGFQVRSLRDAQATRSGILNAFNSLITESRSGDVLAIQYAGHGTQLQDVDGDDEDGQDEALCPHDFSSGAFLIDDDIRELFSKLPAGVNLTCFFDCCHSGSATRFAASTATSAGGAGDQRRRFMPATAEMQQKHREFRSATRGTRALAPPSAMRNVAFAACQDHEVAWESNGHGDFTVRASRVLTASITGMTNQQFQERILAEFGTAPRQKPRIDCADTALSLGFLQPLDSVPALKLVQGL
ncbi:MAG TPA: caspase family protein [Povalibacter sp.]